MNELHNIVIVGGGAGGLELATLLGAHLGKPAKAKITLVDQNLTHIWKPLLHEIAVGALNAHTEELNYFAHAAQHDYTFVLGRFIQLDRANKSILLEHPFAGVSEEHRHYSLNYDTLIFAIGSTSNDFNTEGVREHCHFLDNRAQAEQFQQQLLRLYLTAQTQTTTPDLNIAIIGAGATGVELAAELVQSTQSFQKYGLNKIDPKSIKISLIEAADRILPALSEDMAQHTSRELHAANIQILTHKRVSKIDAQQIYFSQGSSIPADLKVWCAGIQAPKVFQQLAEFEKDHLNRLKVYATLQTKTDPNIFAFGDCAHCQPVANEPVLGPRAQVASQQAHFLVNAMSARIKNKALPMFKFSDKGSLVSLSHHKAVGELLGQVNVQGWVAKSLYVSLYRMHQTTLHGYTHTAYLMVKDAMNKKIAPKIKLH
ncbi:NAD(P)/FAD-dependent oxidoreductase [Acinetobacter sp. NigerLNRRAM0016]